jgi:hypothetical protein
MTSLTTKHTKLLAALAVAGGALWFAAGAIHLTGPEIHEDLVQTTVEHTILALFSGALVLTAAGVAVLGRLAGNHAGTLVAIIGMIALALAGTASNLHGEDYEWFMIAAPVTNLMWLIGSVAVAVSLKRTGRVSRWVYIGLPLVQILALPLHPIGGGLVGGAYWIAVGMMLAAGAIDRREPVPATA